MERRGLLSCSGNSSAAWAEALLEGVLNDAVEREGHELL